ncbi:MAG: DOMON-like domain-containing protein [Steroidobacteraceae bacterium]
MSQVWGAGQRVTLRPYAAAGCAAVAGIDVTLRRMDTQLLLGYRLSGELAGLRIPQLDLSERRDELWRHTCAELFVAAAGQKSYGEFNFSPSTHWAAYEFSAYRQDRQDMACTAPVIQLDQAGSLLSIEVSLQLPDWLAQASQLQASVTMVVEDAAGQYSYWAAQHAAAQPDFHDRRSFVLTI